MSENVVIQLPVREEYERECGTHDASKGLWQIGCAHEDGLVTPISTSMSRLSENDHSPIENLFAKAAFHFGRIVRC